MKTKNLITVTLLMLIAFAVACNNELDPPSYTNGNGYENGNDSVNYPVIIPFTEFSLEETSCRWKNLKYYRCEFDWNNWDSSYKGEIIIINNKEELENYIECFNENFPEIDFSTYTLLLANGLSPNNVEAIKNIAFSKRTANEYILDIIIHLGAARVIDQWNISILVPKIAGDANIKFDIQQSQP